VLVPVRTLSAGVVTVTRVIVCFVTITLNFAV
jgi:hypothetical protein